MYALPKNISLHLADSADLQIKPLSAVSTLSKLIKESVNGNPLAQRELYELHRVRWYMTSMRFGKNKVQAEDILQEGLIGIYQSLHQFDGQKSVFATWSNRVVVNAALKYLKKYTWTDTLGDFGEVEKYQQTGEDVISQLRVQELTKLIQRLPVGYRVVFNMYAIEGYTHEEIAKALGIKVGTSKSQLFKARKTLRTYLENQLMEN